MMKRRARTVLVSAVVMSPVAVVAAFAGVSRAAGSVYYVAPNGSDSAAGTQSAPWASIAHAQSVAGAGDTVYLRGGTYSFTNANKACASQTARVDAITLNKSGSSGSPIRYWAYPGERPHFDFSGMTGVDCRIKGYDVTGSYVYLKGLEVTGVRQNNNNNHESWGISVTGSNNTFEHINAHHNMGPGLFIQNGGSDLINAFSSVLIENSWAWHNGYLPGTNTASGNGNGFKMGGYGGGYVSNGAKHTVRFSVAFNNRASGVYANHHTLANDYFDNTSYNNGTDYNMLGVNSSGSAIGIGNLRNNIAYGGTL